MEAGVVTVLAARCAIPSGDVEDVIVNAHAAGPAKLPPFADELTVRRQDLQPIVVRSPTKRRPVESIASECGLSNWPDLCACRTLDERPFLRQMDDPPVRLRVDVTVSDVEVAVGRDRNIGRLVEEIL